MPSWMRYYIGVLKEAMRRFEDDDHAVYAGHMAFTLLMSLGPFIICAIILAQQFDPDAAQHLVDVIASLREGALIPGPMAELLSTQVERVAPDANETDLTGARWWSVAILAAIGLYAGSSAFEAARNGFNEAYDTRDRRHVVFRRMQSHLLALGIATLFVGISTIFVVSTVTLNFAAGSVGEAGLGRLMLIGLSVVVVISMFWGLLLGVHVTLPRGYVKNWHLYVWANDEIDDIRAVKVPLKPGVRFTTAVWIIFAVIYSFAIGRFIQLDANHGALAGVVATLIFFYVSAALIFFGAQINIAIATIGRDGKPMWPHPQIPRPIGFDETKQDAYRVLAFTQPQRKALRKVLHVMRGGSACRRPDDVISDEGLLRDKQRALDVLSRQAREAGDFTPRRSGPTPERGATIDGSVLVQGAAGARAVDAFAARRVDADVQRPAPEPQPTTTMTPAQTVAAASAEPVVAVDATPRTGLQTGLSAAALGAGLAERAANAATDGAGAGLDLPRRPESDEAGAGDDLLGRGLIRGRESGE